MPRLRDVVSLVIAFAGAGSIFGCSDDETDPHGGGGSGGAGGSDGGAGGAGGAEVMRADPTGSRATGALNRGRSHHTATLLPDGRVIVVGGELASGIPITSVEVFDPGTELWSELESLPEARSNHTTTLLPDGTLLIAGGALSNDNGSPSPDGVVASALIYDPDAGVVDEIPFGPRAGHHALPLSDGNILMVGGSSDEVGSACTTVPDCFYGKAIATADIYDVATSTFSPTDDMAGPRMLFGSVLLDDGTPLVVGGATDNASLDSVEAFVAEAFVTKASLAHDRLRPTVVKLGNGTVIAAAGKIANVGPIGVTEIYDPASDAWTEGPSIGTPRTGAPGVTLQSGNALVVGGYDQNTGDLLDELSIFDQTSQSWVALAPMVDARAVPTATLLTDGRVLIAGGSGANNHCEIVE